jgi:hypothetical protein
MKELSDHFKYEPLSPIQFNDVFKGKEEFLAFYTFFEKYYTELKKEVLSILYRLGEATVPQIVKDFNASHNKYVQFKSKSTFIKVTSSIEVLVANIFKEANIERRKKGNRIVFFSTPER